MNNTSDYGYISSGESLDGPRLGSLRVAADYQSGIMIEEYDYHQSDEPIWAIPGWFEDMCPQLMGPFPSVQKAQETLDHYLDKI